MLSDIDIKNIFYEKILLFDKEKKYTFNRVERRKNSKGSSIIYVSLNCIKHGERITSIHNVRIGRFCDVCGKELAYEHLLKTIANNRKDESYIENRKRKILSKVEKKHCSVGKKYNYGDVIFKNNTPFIHITCPICDETQLINAKNAWKTGSGCKNCYKTESEIQQEVKKYLLKYGKENYQIGKVKKNIKLKKPVFRIEIICPIHGKNNPCFENIKRGHICTKCSYEKVGKLVSKRHRMSEDELIARVIKKHKSVGLTNYSYGKILYKERIRRGYKEVIPYIELICNEHGTSIVSVRNIIARGSGCSKCADENWSKKSSQTNKEILEKAEKIHKYENITFGKVFRVKEITENDCFKMTPYIEVICPTHGLSTVRVSHVLNLKKLAGCPLCGESIGEKKIREWLNCHGFVRNINYEDQKTFSDLKYIHNKGLSYDFYIPEKKLLIEYNGRQHYSASEFFGGEKTFKSQIIRDNIKREFANEKGYELLIIPYTELQNIEKILEKKIIDGLDIHIKYPDVEMN